MAQANSLGYSEQGLIYPASQVKEIDALSIPLVSTTSSTAVTAAGSATITVASATNIYVGSSLYIDTGTQQEIVIVTALSGTSVTAVFTKTHSGTYVVTLTTLRQTIAIADPTNAGSFASVVAKAGASSGALSTQNFIDSARVPITFVSDSQTIAATAETLLPFTLTRALVGVGTQTSYTVPAGKSFRLQSITFVIIGLPAAGLGNSTMVVRMRGNPGGTAVVGSQLLLSLPTAPIGNGNAVALSASPGSDFEISTGESICFTTQVASASFLSISVDVFGYEF